MITKKLRILSALLALAMLFALMPTAAFAEGESYYTYQWNADHKVTFRYTLDSENNATITGAGADLPADGVVEIPEKIESHNVTAIGGSAFYRRPDLKEIDLKSATHLTSIGDAAFKFASALTTVTLPEASLQTIGGSAFNSCTALKSINIPSTVTAIGGWCFQDCYGLEEVTFAADSKLTTIQGGTFINCYGLKTITIPKSVELINRDNSNGAFSGCNALESVIFETGSHLKTIEGSAFSYCSSLKTITIPQSVESIQTYISVGAFSECSALESVIFEPDSKLTTVAENAFRNCDKLTIYGESKIKNILTQGNVGATFLSLDELNPVVTFDVDGNVYKTQNAKNNNFKAVKPENNPIKDGWNFIGWYTKNEDNEYKPFDFNTTITEDITLYARWTASGTCGDNLTWTLDDSGTLTISGTGAMADYDDTDKQPWANQRSSINKVVIGDGVTSIGDYAFALCKSLSEITIPAKVERIGEYAFYDCYDHTNHSGGLTTVTFAENSCLTTIEEYAFYRCMYLEKIEIPASVTSIGGYAFNSCENLKELAFAPNSQLKSIGEYAFGAVSTDTVSPAYTSVQIPASVTEIGQNAFYRCTELKTVEFEEGSQLKALGDGVFVDCGKLETVELPSGITKIGAGAFATCGSLKEFTIPANVETIGETAFALCEKLEKITIPKSVKKIGQAAFARCPLKTVYYDGTAEEWANIEIDETKIEIADTDFSNGILKTTTVITSKEDEPAKPTQYPIIIDNGTAYIDGEPVTEAKENDVVTIKADETALEGMVFERWEVRKGEVKLADDHAVETSFTMPAGEVQLEAMYQAADVQDSGWDAATVVTGAVIGTGTAVLAYHIGLEVYAEQVLGKDVAVPRTRAEVALLAWQLAGSPAVNVEGEPLSEAAQAERWAVESGLMQPDAEGNFNGAKKMSKLKALRTLEKAKQ